MQKDVIYIDTEDDITAIIGKVRDSEHKIVALVPPKRIGAIQSAVNLKLVHRAAEQAGKHLVMISSNAALMALAGSAGIPVAKNLQSKPEIAEIPALDIDGDDVIDGNDLMSEPSAPNKDAAAVAEGVERTESAATPKAALGATAVAAAPVAKRAGKSKIPDFDKFRKKLFLIIAALILVAGFIVWAVVFAPMAKITITARTSDSSLSTQVKVGDALTTSLQDGSIKSVTKTAKKDVSVPFTATGSKNVGDKATGSVSFSSCSGFSAPSAIPAGSTVVANGNNYVTQDVAAFSQDSIGNGCIVYKTNSVAITAAEGGADYNVSGATFKVGGDSEINGSGSASGGTDKTVAIVKQSDVDAVSDDVTSSSDGDDAKKSLTNEFGDEYVVLSDSFDSDTSSLKPNPAVGGEASNGKGAVEGTVTFSLTAIPKAELSTFLTAYFDQQIDGQDNQKVYDNGANSISFTNVDKTKDGYTVNVTTNGKIGPKIDEKSLKDYAKGKRLGEIQSYVQNINGVDGVEVKFSPFWVSSAPNNVDKIHIEFKVND